MTSRQKRRATSAATAREWLLEELTIDEIAAAADHVPARGSRVAHIQVGLLDRPHFEFACLFVGVRIEPHSPRPLFCAYGTVAWHHTGPFVDELTITSFRSDAPPRQRKIDTPIMRIISPPAILAAVRDELDGELLLEYFYEERGRQMLGDNERKRLEQIASPVDSPSTRRRRRSPEFYERVAIAYLELIAQGVTRRLHAELAKQLGLDETDTRQVRDLIRRARELGFLSFSTGGRAGAEPGPNLTDKTTPQTNGTERRDPQ